MIYELSGKEQEILDSGLEQALNNVENFEGIKTGIIRRTALGLFQDAHTNKSKIAGLMVQTFARDKEASKKTGISRAFIYRFLATSEFKDLKDEKHANSRRGRGNKAHTSVTRFRPKTSNTSAPTCTEILTEEIRKIREQTPQLSSKQIRNILITLQPVKQFTASTLRREFGNLLPLQQHHKSNDTPTISSSLPQHVLNQQELEINTIERMKTIQDILEWLTGMDEPDRTAFRKNLPKGKAFSLALQEKCVDHIRVIVHMMLDSDLETFLKYIDDLTHVSKVFDETLWEEKLVRENKRNMSMP